MDRAAAHATVLDFERGYYERAAALSAPHPLGVALRDDAVPRVHMLNMLRVTAREAGPEELTGELDVLQGHGLHRAAYVEDDTLGLALAAPLRRRGFVVERHLYMALRREDDRDPGHGLAEEVDARTHAAVEAATTRQRPHGDDEEVGSALVFVVAEDDDWPKELYGKLGFDPVGASWNITRDPA